MKNNINLENQEKRLSKIIGKLKEGYLGYGNFANINIVIPPGLFYYAESFDNGNESQLEGGIISIEFSGYDNRDARYIEILIREECIGVENCAVFDNSVPSHIELNYQTARKFVLQIISIFSPHSVNLTTK